MASRKRALLIGCEGGIGRAVLSLLTYTAAGRRIATDLDALVLVDAAPGAATPPHLRAVRLPPTRITSARALARLVREHAITEVIDLSAMDTTECTEVCDALGADFLCTSIEEWPGCDPVPTDEAIARLLPPRQPARPRQSHLVGSGANPGIVNALVFSAIEEFARRAGTAPSADALQLYAILITEEDTTHEPGIAPSRDVFAMTWNPLHCLQELLEPEAFIAAGGRALALGHAPIACRYAARCGYRVIEGFLVPHEEVVTLSRRFPSVEMAFIYAIPPAARLALEAHPERNRPELWPTRRLYPPWTRRLAGEDRLGVLLCSRTYGELWVGFDTHVSAALDLGTNATELQVAAGVIAGWSQLGRRRGIHFVEDLDTPEFVATLTALLGPLVVVHDPLARPLSLAGRRRPAAMQPPRQGGAPHATNATRARATAR